MSLSDLKHVPVLLNEVIEALNIVPDGIYVDCTFGRGGHSSEILKRLGKNGRLIVLDKDPNAIKAAELMFNNDERVLISKNKFSLLLNVLNEHKKTGTVNGVLLDLGVSSPQLDDSKYGFSFMHDGELDMRMDPDTGITAANWINSASSEEIADVLYHYGEERYSRRIAAAIVNTRSEIPILRTRQLAKIITDAIPRKEKNKDPATRSFQAIRIYINDEIEEIKKVLEDIFLVLKPGGRLVVISFHSLEDRIVKRFLQKQARGDEFPEDIPVTSDQLKPKFRIIGKAKKPSSGEISDNPRARSAILRVGEKIAA